MTPAYMTAHDIATAFDTGNERKTWSCRKFTSNDIEQVTFKVGSDLIELNYNCAAMKMEVTFKKFVASWGDYCKAITRGYFYVLHCLYRGGIPLSLPEKHDECSIVIRMDGETRIRTYVEYVPTFKGHEGWHDLGRFPAYTQKVGDIMSLNFAVQPLMVDKSESANLIVDTPDQPITLPLVDDIPDTEETQQENTDD